MQYDAYTDDAIYRAMGIAGRVAEGEMRVLLKPSFHAEVCILIRRGEMEVVGLEKQLWLEPAWRAMERGVERVVLGDSDVGTLWEFFRRGYDESRRSDQRIVCCDGMPVAVESRELDVEMRFSGHPLGQMEVFVAGVVRMAHGLMKAALLRNRLADCGMYVGLSLPKVPKEPDPQRTRILVLGEEANRGELMDALKKISDHQK